VDYFVLLIALLLIVTFTFTLVTSRPVPYTLVLKVITSNSTEFQAVHNLTDKQDSDYVLHSCWIW